MKSVASVRVDYPDDDLQRRVRNYLTTRHFPGFRQLTVSVRGGAVTLTGRLRSFHEKQVALNCCQRVAGVLSLIDRVTVDRDKPK